MKFSFKEGRKFGWDGINGVALTGNSITSGSVAYTEVGSIDSKGVVKTGRHGKIKTTSEDRFYFVIQGKGKFTVGKETFDVEEKDVIVIPKNTAYDFK
ncbi:MAG TPA: cupin domain-containing protein [archaeon]|nr:cupin domain-containing protein [archaeon]